MTLRCLTPEGARQVSIDHEAKRPFANAIGAMLDLHATRVEALDRDGNILRTKDLEPEPEPEEEPDAEPVELLQPKGPKESELFLVSQLIANAYREGAREHRDFTDMVFAKLIALTETAFSRLEGFERAWQRMHETQRRAFAQGGGGAPEPEAPAAQATGLEQLLHTFLAAHMGAAGLPVSPPTAPKPAPPPAAANGVKEA